MQELTCSEFKISEDEKFYVQQVYDVLIKYDLVRKSVKDKNDKLKYPKKLDYDRDFSQRGTFELNKFYYINFDKPVQAKSYALMVLVIFVIISFCLFPLWPLKMKNMLWWFIVMILVALVSTFIKLKLRLL